MIRMESRCENVISVWSPHHLRYSIYVGSTAMSQRLCFDVAQMLRYSTIATSRLECSTHPQKDMQT